MKLYETITDKNWTQGEFAVTKDGRVVGSRRPNAAAWCLAGHLVKIRASKKRRARVILALKTLYPDRAAGAHGWTNYPIYHFNDHPSTTVEDVIRVCKVADV